MSEVSLQEAPAKTQPKSHDYLLADFWQILIYEDTIDEFARELAKSYFTFTKPQHFFRLFSTASFLKYASSHIETNYQRKRTTILLEHIPYKKFMKTSPQDVPNLLNRTETLLRLKLNSQSKRRPVDILKEAYFSMRNALLITSLKSFLPKFFQLTALITAYCFAYWIWQRNATLTWQDALKGWVSFFQELFP